MSNDDQLPNVDGGVELPPVPAQPSPWVDEPKYGQYAVGGAPVPPAAPAYGQMPYAPAPPPPQAFAHPKPGIVPLRPLGLGDIFAGAWHAVWHNPGVMIGLPILIILAATIISALIGLALNAPLMHLNDQVLGQTGLNDILRDFQISANDATFFTGSSAASGILMALVTPIINGILAISISQSVLGNRISMGDAWGRVKGRIGALIGWSILMTLGIILLTLLAALAIAGLTIAAANVSEGFAVALALLLALGLLVLVLWLSIKLLFVAPIIAIERCGIREALRRSWELTRGHFWRILGIYLLGTLLVSLVSGLLTTPLTVLSGAIGIGTGSFGAPLILDIIRIVLSNALSMIFTSGLLTLLYIDTRTRSEGLHNSLISATAGPTYGTTSTGW